MGLNRPTQQLRRELLDMAYRNESAAIDLVHAAELLPTAQALALMKVVGQLHADCDALRVLADRVRDGNISAMKSGG